MKIADNVKRLRTEQNISQAKLAKLSGVSQQLISQIEAGTNRTTKNLPALARAFGVPVSDIDPTFDPTSDVIESTVPLMGYLGAGAEIEPEFEQVPPEGLEEITLPIALQDDMIAFKVRGVSMLPVFKPDAVIVVYREQRRPIETFYGEEAAVRTLDGRRFIKTILRGSDPSCVTLSSWNALLIEDVQIEWIGEIFAVLPPSGLRRMLKAGGIQGRLRMSA